MTARKNYGAVTCVICGATEQKLAPNQIFCQRCRKDEKAQYAYKLRKEREEIEAKTRSRSLQGLSIVEVDRLAKTLHISYGQLVAGWQAEKQKAAGAATPTT